MIRTLAVTVIIIFLILIITITTIIIIIVLCTLTTRVIIVVGMIAILIDTFRTIIMVVGIVVILIIRMILLCASTLVLGLRLSGGHVATILGDFLSVSFFLCWLLRQTPRHAERTLLDGRIPHAPASIFVPILLVWLFLQVRDSIMC